MKPLVLVIAAVLSSAWSALAFSLDDIHFWVGEGTSRAAVALDWNRAGSPALVWGVRWKASDSAPDLADALLAIAREDPRLSLFTEEDSGGFRLLAAGYDVDDAAAQFRLRRQDGAIVAETSDPAALVAGGGGAWLPLSAPASAAFDPAALTSADGLSGTPLASGSWHVLRFVPEGQTPASPAAPAAAESPYGWRVISASTEETKRAFIDSDNVLGAPLRLLATYQWNGQAFGGVVSPVQPAFDGGCLYTLMNILDSDAHVTIAFDHRVYDDPANPFGIDFLVFGNSLVGGQGNVYATTDPSKYRLNAPNTSSGTLPEGESGLVEVSQDGETWYSYRNGPYADSPPGTLGHVYDPANADTNLFAGNLWWGAPADATLPVDPAIRRTDIGKSPVSTLADLCVAFDGSAGGTGFDLAAFPSLPPDETGRRWIQYVRISPLPTGETDDEGDPVYSTPEVDAVSDVAPRPAYDNWVRTNYSWRTLLQDPDRRRKDAVAANGRTNLENAFLGLAPDEVSAAAVRIAGFRVADDAVEIAVDAPSPAFDMVRVAVSPTPDGDGTAVLPVYEGVDGEGRQLFALPLSGDADAAFFKLRLE